MNYEAIHAMEVQVISCFLDQVLADNCLISVDDGEAAPLKRSNDKAAILDALFSVDEEHLIICKPDGSRAAVFLVHGNDGYDVISNYSVSLEKYMGPVDALIDQLQENLR